MTSVWPRFAFVVLCSTIVLKTDATDFVVKDTLHGKVRGYVHTVLDNQGVERYFGVPFAAPPVGDLRFEYPVDPTPWSTVRNTTRLPPACLQTMSKWSYVQDHVPGFRTSSEDCLYMNIYVPQTGGDEEKMAVLVHVHGGSNEVGMAAMYHADVLAAMGKIVVVTFNYRLGPFGFLSCEDEDFPGNYGLMDQTKAFEWVSKNIHFFGGDPTKVTVEGHSAGGGDVGFHIVSPLSQGLFRYAIMQSGSPTAYWALVRPASSVAPGTKRFAQRLGCFHPDPKHIKECLKKLDWRKIINKKYDHVGGLYNYSPVVDNVFIDNTPEELLKTAELNGKSFMTGVTRDEGSLTAQIVDKEMSKFEFSPVFARTFSPPPVIRRNIPEIIDLVVHEYKPWWDPHNKTENIFGLSDVVGDSTFVAPAIDVARRLSQREDNVYLYSFEYRSPLSPQPTWLGVPHGRDQFYLFGYPFTGHPLYKYDEEDREVSRTFIEMWSNFVKTGRPRISSPEPKEFEPYRSGPQSYIKISASEGKPAITTAKRLRARQVAFWNSLLPKMRNKRSSKNSDGMGKVTWLFIALCLFLLLTLLASMAFVVHYRRKSLAPPMQVVENNSTC